jgi:hypothetical protein
MLFAARQAAGLTQKQLAKLAGTTQQVISQLIVGAGKCLIPSSGTGHPSGGASIEC